MPRIITLNAPRVEIGYCYYHIISQQHKGRIRVTVAFLPDEGLMLTKMNTAYALTAGYKNRVAMINALLPDVDPFSYDPSALYLDEQTEQIYTFKH